MIDGSATKDSALSDSSSALPARQLVDQLQRLGARWMERCERETAEFAAVGYPQPRYLTVLARCAHELTLELAALLDPARQETRPRLKQLTCKRCGCPTDTGLCGYGCEFDSTRASERDPDQMEVRVYEFVGTEQYENRSPDGDGQVSAHRVAAPDKAGRNSDP